MAVWEYKKVSSDLSIAVSSGIIAAKGGLATIRKCACCSNQDLRYLDNKGDLPDNWKSRIKEDATLLDDAEEESIGVLSCPNCGWWYIQHRKEWCAPGNDYDEEMNGAAACLKTLDKHDISLAIETAKNDLLNFYQKTKRTIDPSLFEEVVGSVLSDLGYNTRVTGISNDGGIDVIADGPDNSTVGVQVKRWKNTIKVSQVRELIGALVLRGLHDGVIVTTSDYQSGCEMTTKQLIKGCYKIELVNGKRFFEALNFVQRNEYAHRNEVLSMVSPDSLAAIYSDNINEHAPYERQY